MPTKLTTEIIAAAIAGFEQQPKYEETTHRSNCGASPNVEPQRP
jgi:hypothetical protein